MRSQTNLPNSQISLSQLAVGRGSRLDGSHPILLLELMKTEAGKTLYRDCIEDRNYYLDTQGIVLNPVFSVQCLKHIGQVHSLEDTLEMALLRMPDCTTLMDPEEVRFYRYLCREIKRIFGMQQIRMNAFIERRDLFDLLHQLAYGEEVNEYVDPYHR